ncbi:hypothetical protein T08_10390 [Trichinella sp. T8]|nr:hypothetical protein T08_10390 [Trichinella sp. T8]
MSNRPSVVSLIIRLIIAWITSSHEVRIGAIPCKFSWIQLSHFVLAIHKELQGILSLWLIPIGIKAFQMWHRKHQMHCHSRKGIASLYCHRAQGFLDVFWMDGWMDGWNLDGWMDVNLHLGFNGFVLNPELGSHVVFRSLMGGIKRECNVLRECKLQKCIA